MGKRVEKTMYGKTGEEGVLGNWLPILLCPHDTHGTSAIRKPLFRAFIWYP